MSITRYFPGLTLNDFRWMSVTAYRAFSNAAAAHRLEDYSYALLASFRATAPKSVASHLAEITTIREAALRGEQVDEVELAERRMAAAYGGIPVTADTAPQYGITKGVPNT